MVTLTQDGFFELTKKPTIEELNEYYSQKYYQNDQATYEKQYSSAEIEYVYNKIAQKHLLFENLLPTLTAPPSLLDVGCGEGFCLAYFFQKGWLVKGLDFSEFGLSTHHPHLKPFIEVGDVYDNIRKLIQRGDTYNVIWIDNVLEHVLDPFQLLQDCYALTADNGILVVEVPNDFSPLQLQLKKDGMIHEDFWVLVPDHISYFNKDGLVRIAGRAGWDEKICIADFPIDFNLFNPESNYITDRSKGKNAHLQRIKIENLLHAISPAKTNQLYKAFADLGLGRQLIAFFQKNK